jgi:sugar phosphate isomerase/epimerase
MPRPVILYSGTFWDQPLEQLAARAAEWGYAGFELAVGEHHLQIQRASEDESYCSRRLELLNQYDLHAPVVAAFRVSQIIGDRIDERHRSLAPPHVWGDGHPDGVRTHAIEELVATIRVAQRLGAAVVTGFTGSPIWSFVNSYPGSSPDIVDEAYREFVRTWQPILDVCSDCGVRFALEVHPGQLAFDFYSTERLLDVLDRRPEFGLCVDPSHLHWQGMDPAAFVRHFADRVYHVHMKDIVLRLDGRTSLLNSHLPYGDPRRGWEFRSPGRGGIAWEEFVRALNEIEYDGPLSVDWRDEGLDVVFGVQDACQFVKQLDFPGRSNAGRDRL